MPIQKITIEQFLTLSQQHLVVDVRSPGEYHYAHIPGVYSLPLFTDEERKVVGTAYKQQGRKTAIKIGLDYFGVKMRKMIEEVETIIENKKKSNSDEQSTILVHCWRGGMRSYGVAWLFDLYGFKVYMLSGGYKAYRNWVIQQFNVSYNFIVVGGYTGSGKTILLETLAKKNNAVVNLEALANHKGSALGGLDEKQQPSQEMFENMLAQQLKQAKGNNPNTKLITNKSIQDKWPDFIFIEDESQRIGNRHIPKPLWQTIRNSPVYFLDIPFEERLNFLTKEYGIYKKEKLINAILRIQKRLGGLETKNAIACLIEENYKACFGILLKYYDKWYKKALNNRANSDQLIQTISCTTIDEKTNVDKLLKYITHSAIKT